MGITTSQLRVTPAAASVTTPAAGTLWTPSAWVEVAAATSADWQLAGIINHALAGVGTLSLVDVAVGAAGAETVIASVRWLFTGPLSYAGLNVCWFPAPINLIPSGSRVSIRAYRTGSLTTHQFQLAYYSGSADTIATTSRAVCVPYAAAGLTLTTPVTPWASSAWVEITPGLDGDIGAYAIALQAVWTGTGAREDEWDIGLGAAGAEVVATTLRSARYPLGTDTERGGLRLPAILPIAAGTRIAVRARASLASITFRDIALDYYGEWVTPVPPEPVVTVRTAAPRRLIRRLRQAAHQSGDGRFLTHHAFELELEAGMGLTTGQGADPQVMLRYSDDGGHTWSEERWVSAGLRGAYGQRAEWRRLGQARSRVYQVVVSDPVKWTLIGASLDVTPDR